jgi:hypothetical protein
LTQGLITKVYGSLCLRHFVNISLTEEDFIIRNTNKLFLSMKQIVFCLD